MHPAASTADGTWLPLAVVFFTVYGAYGVTRLALTWWASRKRKHAPASIEQIVQNHVGCWVRLSVRDRPGIEYQGRLVAVLSDLITLEMVDRRQVYLARSPAEVELISEHGEARALQQAWAGHGGQSAEEAATH